MMRWPEEVLIKEVGPRDGLQNEKQFMETVDKVTWINMLSQTGIKEIEYSAFVHPKWVPALADAKEVGKQIDRNPNVKYSALVPNEKGLEHALEAGIDGASVFMSASESHNEKNINKSIAHTYPVVQKVIEQAKVEQKHVTGYVSTVFDCPYEGKIDVEQVLSVIDRLFTLGVDEVSLGDTIGTAVPQEVERLLETVLYHYPAKRIILHFHDTFGMGIANIITAIQYGIVKFDTSLGGLGGCPYAPGATGNVATNDLLYLLDQQQIYTGIDSNRILQATKYIQKKMDKPLPSKNFAYHISDEEKFAMEEETHLRKREMLFFFLKKQYDKFLNKSS